mmetsp:Transcript_65033/g.201582  ORF Transcript_65033/g.201582 Transcript_65033/m.201582 type:complete len:226 (+) Transcript_65033:88-765(+)
MKPRRRGLAFWGVGWLWGAALPKACSAPRFAPPGEAAPAGAAPAAGSYSMGRPSCTRVMYHLIFEYQRLLPSSPPSSSATGPEAIFGSRGSEPVAFRAAWILSVSPRLGRRPRRRTRLLSARGSAFSSAVARWPSTVEAVTCLAFFMPTAAMSRPWPKRSRDSATVGESFGAPGAGLGFQLPGSFSTSSAVGAAASACAAAQNSSRQALMTAARPATPSKRMPAS